MPPVLDGRQVESLLPSRDRVWDRDTNGPCTAIENKLIERKWFVFGHRTWIVGTLEHHQHPLIDLPPAPHAGPTCP